MEKKYKSTKSIKAAGFFKRNIYYFLTGGALLVTALVLTLVFTLGGNKVIPTVTPPAEEDPGTNVDVKPVTFILPLENGTLAKGYAEHSHVYNSTLKQWETHMALDFVSESGAQVYAAFEGTVESVDDTILDGTVITIAHKDGVKSIYMSLDSNVLVSAGQEVTTGQPIGTVSASQIVEKKQGVHLHFEAMLDGETVDPTVFMPDFSDK